jgi:hypothetical protein
MTGRKTYKAVSRGREMHPCLIWKKGMGSSAKFIWKRFMAGVTGANKPTSQVRGERGPVSKLFFLGGPGYTLLVNIFALMTSWLDCMIRALSMASALGRPM